jgi:hypothetical protein
MHQSVAMNALQASQRGGPVNAQFRFGVGAEWRSAQQNIYFNRLTFHKHFFWSRTDQ